MSWKSTYIDAIVAWDKTHRLVGKIPAADLVDQSIEALRSLPANLFFGETLFVDVGAGQGLLGIPALNLFPGLRVMFVEPDVKKTSFLRNYLFGIQKELGPRSTVEAKRLQDVSRGTQKNDESSSARLFARAFSGEVLIEEAVSKSKFSECELFIFRSDGARHFFEKTC